MRDPSNVVDAPSASDTISGQRMGFEMVIEGLMMGANMLNIKQPANGNRDDGGDADSRVDSEE
jgi:hypothetical protein